MSASKPRVAVAMSGGLDSSVAAALLQAEGLDVFGLTAITWSRGPNDCAEEDIRGAKRVAASLGIAHHVLDLSEQFERDVVRGFADEYARGRTPSPCAVCNRTIKFGVLLDRALSLGADSMATGHYVRTVSDSEGPVRLLRGIDRSKDQSYFLFELSQEQLRRARFPLGDRKKDDIRAWAAEVGLPTSSRGESQDLCFVPPGEHWRVAEQYRPDARKRGAITDRGGRVLGSHDGIHRFTVGQRRGLGVAVGKPVYVAEIRAESNEVVVGPREDLESPMLVADGLHWISGSPPSSRFRTTVQIRYNHAPAGATVTLHAHDRATVAFDEPQFAITPGQVAAFYDGDELLGGGWIRAATTPSEPLERTAESG